MKLNLRVLRLLASIGIVLRILSLLRKLIQFFRNNIWAIRDDKDLIQCQFMFGVLFGLIRWKNCRCRTWANILLPYIQFLKILILFDNVFYEFVVQLNNWIILIKFLLLLLFCLTHFLFRLNWFGFPTVAWLRPIVSFLIRLLRRVSLLSNLFDSCADSLRIQLPVEISVTWNLKNSHLKVEIVGLRHFLVYEFDCPLSLTIHVEPLGHWTKSYLPQSPLLGCFILARGPISRAFSVIINVGILLTLLRNWRWGIISRILLSIFFQLKSFGSIDLRKMLKINDTSDDWWREASVPNVSLNNNALPLMITHHFFDYAICKVDQLREVIIFVASIFENSNRLKCLFKFILACFPVLFKIRFVEKVICDLSNPYEGRVRQWFVNMVRLFLLFSGRFHALILINVFVIDSFRFQEALFVCEQVGYALIVCQNQRLWHIHSYWIPGTAPNEFV